MAAICVLGAQWGDEGKGKVIDLLAADADVVVRFAGGNNAGHTVVIGDRKLAVHLLPAGVFRPTTRNVIGGGVVIDPWHLQKEMAAVREAGYRIELGQNLLISRSAHLILPLHRHQDRLLEEVRGSGKIGTTGRGIGPAYQDRAGRAGLRMGDLLDRDHLSRRLHALVEEKNRFLGSHGLAGTDARQLLEELLGVTESLLSGIVDTGLVVRQAVRERRQILFEGAQGVMLDVDLGTYPFVTSTSVGIGGVGGGAAVSPRALDEVIGVAKAYTTRVGEGPFPSELLDERGVWIREHGKEYGTTTGRPRRCGWFDCVAVRYVVEVSGADCLYLTNLDVLSGMPQVEVAVAYRIDGQRTVDFPAGLPGLVRAAVECERLPGWTADLTGMRRFEELPHQARDYITFLEERVGVPVRLISVGPEREQVIRRSGHARG